MVPDSLHDKLADIARLEQEHGFLGVRVALKDGAQGATTEELADFVHTCLVDTVALLEQSRKGLIPVAPEYPPKI